MEKEIKKWLEKGLITEDIAKNLLEEVRIENKKRYKLRTTIAIYTIAVILIGIGVISFISANDWILELLNASDLLKIILIFGATCLSLWGGYKLAYEKKKFPKLGNALMVLSTLLIGGTYALIGQTYNINANNSGFIFLWLISILPVAYIFKNYVVNFIAIILFIQFAIFFYMDLNLDELLTWTIFIPILIGTTLYTVANIPVILKNYNNFSLAYKLTGLIPIFTTLLVLTCSVEESYNITSLWYLMPLDLLLVVNILNYVVNEERNHLLKVESIFMGCILIFTVLLLIMNSINPQFVMILVNLALITIIVYGFKYGYKFEHARIIGLTNWFLIIYLLVNYTRWGWSYMDKALFFILGGIMLLVIGMFLERKRKETIKGKENE